MCEMEAMFLTEAMFQTKKRRKHAVQPSSRHAEAGYMCSNQPHTYLHYVPAPPVDVRL